MTHDSFAPDAMPSHEGVVAEVTPAPTPEPDALDLVFADLKGQVREQVGRLRTLGRDVALAAAARVEADAAIAESAVGAFELEPRKRRRRKGQVKRLERLVKRISAVEVEVDRGRRRDLKQVARSVRRIISALTAPVK
jgi:hypothetical protein